MNSKYANTNDATVMQIVSLRLAVGLLGERDAAGWWASSFMSPTSTAFLTPVFGSGLLQARYQGVLEAARRLHDGRIGVGRAFRPFRLSEVMEQRLFEAVQLAGQLLILNQVVLGLQLPFAVLPPVMFTASRAKMRPFVAPRWLTVLAALIAAIIIALNAKLVFDFFSG
jgi:Natural resistance-associated macrophage protein